MLRSRKTAALLLAAGLWPLLIWPNFVRVVATDERAFDGGPTAYLVVHVGLALVSMAFGVALLVVGVRAWRAASSGRVDPHDHPATRRRVRGDHEDRRAGVVSGGAPPTAAD